MIVALRMGEFGRGAVGTALSLSGGRDELTPHDADRIGEDLITDKDTGPSLCSCQLSGQTLVVC